MAVTHFSSDTLTGIRTPLCRTSLRLVSRGAAGIAGAASQFGQVEWFHCLKTQEGLIGFDLGR